VLLLLPLRFKNLRVPDPAADAVQSTSLALSEAEPGWDLPPLVVGCSPPKFTNGNYSNLTTHLPNILSTLPNPLALPMSHESGTTHSQERPQFNPRSTLQCLQLCTRTPYWPVNYESIMSHDSYDHDQKFTIITSRTTQQVLMRLLELTRSLQRPV